MWKNYLSTLISAFWGIRGFVGAMFGFLIGAPAAVYSYDLARAQPMLTWLPELSLMERCLWVAVIVQAALILLFVVRYIRAATPHIKASGVEVRDGEHIIVQIENMSCRTLSDCSLAIDDMIDLSNPKKAYPRKGYDLRPPGPVPQPGYKFPLEPRRPTEIDIASFVKNGRGHGVFFNYLANDQMSGDTPIPVGEYEVHLGIYGTGGASMQSVFRIAINSDGVVLTKPSKCRIKR